MKKAEHQRIDAFFFFFRIYAFNCGLEKTLMSPLNCKEIKPVNPKKKLVLKDWCWNWSLNILATWCEKLTHWKRPWCWERLKAGGEGDDRGWDGRMASPTQWTRVWTSSRSWWWSGKPDVLQSMGSQRVGRDLVTELNWKQCFLDKRFTASKVLHLVIFTYAFCLKFSIFDSPHFYNPWKCYN